MPSIEPMLITRAGSSSLAALLSSGTSARVRWKTPLTLSAKQRSKAAVLHMTRVLARKLAPQRITVNAIAPGPFESKMMHETLETFGDQIKSTIPLGRIGRREDMAGATIYLASRAGAYLTGLTIRVDGGTTTSQG